MRYFHITRKWQLLGMFHRMDIYIDGQKMGSLTPFNRFKMIPIDEEKNHFLEISINFGKYKALYGETKIPLDSADVFVTIKIRFGNKIDLNWISQNDLDLNDNK